MFKLVIENGGEKPVKIGNDNISVIFEDRSGNSSHKKFHIQSQPEFLKDLEKYYHNEENRRINNILRDTDITIQKLKMTASPQMAVRAYMIKLDYSIYKLDLQENQYEQLEDIAPGFLFKEQTIMPHTSILTVVSYDTAGISKGTDGVFKVVVSIDDEDHEFLFSPAVI